MAAGSRIAVLVMAAGLVLSLRARAEEPQLGGSLDLADGFFGGLEGGISVPNSLKFSTDELTADILLKGGYRWGRFGVFAQAGYNSWISIETDPPESPGVFNPGLGGEVLFFEGRARTSLALGPSIYLTDTTNEAGKVGFFLDLRPIGFRFSLGDSWILGVDPIAFNLNVPVLSDIPLLVLKYVTIVTLEYSGHQAAELAPRKPDPAHIGLFLQTSFHFSLLGDDPERSMLADTLGFGLRAGYRLGAWAIFLQLENNRWFTTELGTMSLTPGALNAGLGGEYLWFGGRARSSVVIGSSTVMMDTFLLDEGSVGVFFEIRPLGLRWELADDLYLALDPLTLAIVAPEPWGDEKLVMREYRTLLGLEVDL